MDPVLAEIYRTVITAVPYVLAAYGLLWVGLFGYITVVLLRLSRLEKQLDVVEASMARRDGSSAG
jgi:CcmD family protein